MTRRNQGRHPDEVDSREQVQPGRWRPQPRPPAPVPVRRVRWRRATSGAPAAPAGAAAPSSTLTTGLATLVGLARSSWVCFAGPLLTTRGAHDLIRWRAAAQARRGRYRLQRPARLDRPASRL